MERVFVYGAGGQGKVVIDALHLARCPVEIAMVVDDDPKLHGKTLMGHRITSPREIGSERGFIAIGENASRQRIASRYPGRLLVIVHPGTIIARDVPIGEGTIFVAGSIVNTGSRIGENVIINTSASVDHDCVIEDGVHLAPGCRLCGNVQVGEGSLLGAGTIVVPGIRIGRGVLVHAGQIVTSDVPDGETVRSPRPRGIPPMEPGGPDHPGTRRAPTLSLRHSDPVSPPVGSE
jgi:sugar O-acyltransferase (sialic acid O-acetyltransferase NeuD family)